MIMTNQANISLRYLRYTALILIGAVCVLELYSITHLFMHPDQYRFGTEVAGSTFYSRERYLGYRTLTLVLATASIGVSAFYRDRWWPTLLQFAIVVFAVIS